MKTWLIEAPIALRGADSSHLKHSRQHHHRAPLIIITELLSASSSPLSLLLIKMSNSAQRPPPSPRLPRSSDHRFLVRASAFLLNFCPPATSMKAGNHTEEQSRGVRGHLLTFASSLIFQIISSMQAVASSLESWPSTEKTRTSYKQRSNIVFFLSPVCSYVARH